MHFPTVLFRLLGFELRVPTLLLIIAGCIVRLFGLSVCWFFSVSREAHTIKLGNVRLLANNKRFACHLFRLSQAHQ